MTYETLQQYNITGLDNVFVYIARAEPVFIPALLTAIFLIFMIGVYFGTRKYSGQGDIMAAGTVAGFITMMTATLFQIALGGGLINYIITGISIAVFIVFAFLFMIKRNRD